MQGWGCDREGGEDRERKFRDRSMMMMHEFKE